MAGYSGNQGYDWNAQSGQPQQSYNFEMPDQFGNEL